MSHLVEIKLGVINDDTGVAAHWIELAKVRTNQRTHTLPDSVCLLDAVIFHHPATSFPDLADAESQSVCKYMCGCTHRLLQRHFITLSLTHTSRNTLCF